SGTASGGAGLRSAVPETVEIVTSSPLLTVSSGFNVASKKPQCTLLGAASRRCWAMQGDPCHSGSRSASPESILAGPMWHGRREIGNYVMDSGLALRAPK